MDIQTSLIYVGIVGVCAVVVFAVSMFGIKEKTYDEAIAEQRQMPNEHLLLARSKEKNKDKKQKKAAGKKVKEKPAEQERNDLHQDVHDSGITHEKHHVEFEPEEEILSKPPPQEEKKTKKKKMKPILINKSEHNVVFAGTPPLANHFEESLPKDDLLLKRQLSREDMSLSVKHSVPAKGTSKAEKVSVPKTEKLIVSKDEKVNVQKTEAKPHKTPVVAKVEKVSSEISVVEKTIEASIDKPEESVPSYLTQAVSKEQRTRKKRSELATLQQMTGDREGINVSVIVPLVQKAELSRSEIQILIDLLLNKQQGSAFTNSEWSEGRQDPVVKLKKQLAEKEKALSDEQEAAQAFQSKLKELRSELNTERSRWRQLEEASAAKQIELQHAATRLQHAQEAHKNDKANMTQQLQQLQAKMNEDRAIIRKLQDEQGQSQGVLQQEVHAQRQQLDLHIAHLAEQHQEAETALKGQLNQLHGQLQELENVNASLRAEVQNARENAAARDADIKKYRDQTAHLNNQVVHHENVARDLSHQVEEMRHMKTQLEHQRSTTAGLESQLKYDNDKLRKDLESVNYAYSKSSEAQKEVGRLQTEKDNLLGTVKDLQLKAQQAKEEKERVSAQLSVVEHDVQQLREENESLAAQVTAVTERPAAEGRENGDAEEKPVQGTVMQDSLVEQKEAEVQDLTSQINNHKTEISRLKGDLEAQRTKNNELRTRNWKAMDALSATEKSLENQQKESKKLVTNTSTASRLEEQAVTKQLLERLFPDVRVPACEPHSVWCERFVTVAQASLAELKNCPLEVVSDEEHGELETQVAQLQSAVSHYKTIIQDTEVLLKKLQTSAEEEEVKWREKLLRQEAELEAMKDERDRLADSLEDVTGAQEAASEVCGVEFALGCIEKSLPPIVSQMQTKLRELEEKLVSEELEKRELTVQYAEMQSLLEARGVSPDLAADARQLNEEQQRLRCELASAQDKSREMTKEMVKLRSQVQIGQASFSQEHQLAQDLQHQGLNENHNAAATNGANTETSITESLSVSSEPLTELESKPKSRGKKKKMPNQSSVKRRRFAGWFRKKVAPKKKLNTTI